MVVDTATCSATDQKALYSARQLQSVLYHSQRNKALDLSFSSKSTILTFEAIGYSVHYAVSLIVWSHLFFVAIPRHEASEANIKTTKE